MPLPQVCGVKRAARGVDLGRQPGQAGDAARAHAVGLEHVQAVPGQQLAQLVGLAGHLAPGDADAHPPPQLGVPGVVPTVERFLHPVDRLGLEGFRDPGGVIHRPRWRGVPRHPPALVAVDHQLEPVADGIPHGVDHGQIFRRVRAPEAHLEGREPRRPHTLGPVRPWPRPAGARRWTRRPAPGDPVRPADPTPAARGSGRPGPTAPRPSATGARRGSRCWTAPRGGARGRADPGRGTDRRSPRSRTSRRPSRRPRGRRSRSRARWWRGSTCGAWCPTRPGTAGRAAAGGARCRSGR